MIKSVHNEIDKLMFGLLYAGYLSERLQNTAFFFIDTAFFFIDTAFFFIDTAFFFIDTAFFCITTFITSSRLLTLITFHKARPN